MSKKLSKSNPQYDEMRKKYIQEFEKYLKALNWDGGKINFARTYTPKVEYVDRKATLYFKEEAWYRMMALINEFDKEVAWHGVAKRGENDDYIIKDILVYPQIVTSASVDTDDGKYGGWFDQFDDDTFNCIRMQGHSHVNMAVTPSTTDVDYWDELLSKVNEDSFYIFMIWNKRREKTIKIYDFQKEVMFDTADVAVEIIEEENGLSKFIADAKELVQDKTPAPVTGYTGYTGYSSYYSGSHYDYQKGMWVHDDPPTASTPPSSSVVVVDGGAKTDAVGKEEKKSGKKSRKKDSRPGAGWGFSQHAPSYDGDYLGSLDEYYDDMGDPYGPFGYSERWEDFNET